MELREAAELAVNFDPELVDLTHSSQPWSGLNGLVKLQVKFDGVKS